VASSVVTGHTSTGKEKQERRVGVNVRYYNLPQARDKLTY